MRAGACATLPIIPSMATAARDLATVDEAMSAQFAFCFPNTSLAQAARMMAQNRVHELPVIVDQRCLGYVSYLDILQRYVKARLEGRAADIIRTPLPEVRPDSPLKDAVRILRETGRQVLVVSTPEGMPIGALTVKDVSRVVGAAS
jgi:CBS domain-containing protein